jgi:hypothetical protein
MGNGGRKTRFSLVITRRSQVQILPSGAVANAAAASEMQGGEHVGTVVGNIALERDTRYCAGPGVFL